MNTVSFTRQELYDLVWQNTIVSLSKIYNVSATDLRNACKTLDVPIPEVGYWTKLKFNKPVFKTELQPSARLNDVTLTKGGNSKTKNKAVLKIEENIKNHTNKKNSPREKLVIQAEAALKNNERYVSNGLISSSGETLQIRVSKINVKRALNLYDCLIKAFRACRHKIIVENQRTIAIVNGENFHISLREKLKRVEVPGRPAWDRYTQEPTNLLVLKWDYYISKEWTDGSTKIEDQIPKIIEWFEAKAEALKEERDKARLWRKQFEDEQQKKNEHKQNIENELDRFKQLLAEAKRYNDSKLIEAYINGVADSKQIAPEKTEWIQWAHKKANWYNPQINESDDLLDNIDKNTLTIKSNLT